MELVGFLSVILASITSTPYLLLVSLVYYTTTVHVQTKVRPHNSTGLWPLDGLIGRFVWEAYMATRAVLSLNPVLHLWTLAIKGCLHCVRKLASYKELIPGVSR